MILRITFFNAIIFTCCATNQDDNLRQIQTEESAPLVTKDTTRLAFETVKTFYDTLIPIFDGLFITHSEQDTGAYRKLRQTLHADTMIKSQYGVILYSEKGMYCTPACRKWGVIDSTGRIIVPFICDGVAKIAEHEGIFSIGIQANHLDTGIPRYYYQGQCFHFDKIGPLPVAPEEFSYKIRFGSNYGEEEHIIQQGTAFYLPIKYAKYSKTSSGSHE